MKKGSSSPYKNNYVVMYKLTAIHYMQVKKNFDFIINVNTLSSSYLLY